MAVMPETSEPAASVARGDVTVEDRPPQGLARGLYEGSPWSIGLLGGGVFAGAVAFMTWRLLRRRAASRGRRSA